MFNLDDITKENKKKWPFMSDNSYRILIIGGYVSKQLDTLLNLIKIKNDIDKIYLHPKDLSKPKYQSLIKKGDDAEIKHLNDPKAFIEFSNSMDDVYEDIDEYNPNRKRKILIVFDGKVANIMTNKEFQAVVKGLFFICRKLNISLVFVTQSFFLFQKMSD